MRLKDIIEINFEAFASQKLSIPATPLPYIETIVNNEHWKDNSQCVHKALPFARTALYALPIKSSKVLCQGEDVKKVVELTFDLKDLEIDYLPGDTVGIMPVNRPEDVNFILSSLNILEHAFNVLQISIMKVTQKKAAKLPIYIPETSSYFQLLTYYLNIYSIPKKLFIRTLVNYTNDENERLLLQVLCSKEGADIYNQCFVEERLNFVDLLKMCPSCKPTMGVLIEHLPRLLPRPYSIANSPLKDRKELKIVFSILGEDCSKGLMTSQLEDKAEKFLCNKDNPSTVNLYFREQNNFKYTAEDLDKNIIMVGVGCAVSPFLGFLEHKSELKKYFDKPTKEQCTTWLFSGSRYCSNALYANEIKNHLNSGTLDRYFESFSRETATEFKYVQDHIKANAKNFVNLLSCEETKLFVCADGNEISKKIFECIADCIKSVYGIEYSEALVILQEMKKKFRYIEDVWL